MFRRFLLRGSAWRCFAAPGFTRNRINLLTQSKELQSMFAIVLDKVEGSA